MLQPTTFQVYNASAGSGKTFTLVKEYLKVVLQSDDQFLFQRILAITFTNKAAAEMKERILSNLYSFSKSEENYLLGLIVEETQLDTKIIFARSAKILTSILQNYTAFGITTIDSFTHKIIKTFAFDLGMSLNFEVELDSNAMLSQAVDVLISKIGVEDEITASLIDFSLEKTNEDKSWDISKDLNEFASILLKESDAAHFKELSKKSLLEFSTLKKKLNKHQQQLNKRFREIGTLGIEIIESENLAHSDFFRSLFPKHFIALKESVDKAKFFDDSALKQRIEEGVFYAKSKPDAIKSAIERKLPELLKLYTESEELYQQYVLNKLALKSLVPLAVLTKINNELTQIKEDSNTRLLSEFNQLIADNIKEQPAPFIYERIGQKFMHYFIDEMQDTSVMQWQNLIPLIDNALSQENSNLLLVGDGKQAIYRWRGGKASQFISLGSTVEKSINANPFKVVKEVKQLEINYRSYEEVVAFNNNFFQHVSGFFQNEFYQQLFLEGNKQKTIDKKGGFVSIDFLEKLSDKDENDLKFARKVFSIIENLDPTFSNNEICILVRKKSHAITIANYLSEKNLDIISSETLLLQNSKKVNFIMNFLQMVQNPKDKEAALETLYFLHKHLNLIVDEQLFYKEMLSLDIDLFVDTLNELGADFSIKEFYQIPFFEKIEVIIRGFRLTKSSDAYLQFFLDLAFEQQRKETSVQDFIDYWNQKKDTLSIVTSESKEAIQIMTIHKSKGLEFPIVIFPYDIDIYYQKEPKAWLSELPPDRFEGFNELLVSSTKEIKNLDKGSEIYIKQRSELELDNFNILYVALTRSVEQLYIITEKKLLKGAVPNTNFTSGIFIDFLVKKNLWKDSQLSYSFGQPTRVSKPISEKSIAVTQEKFLSTSWKDHNIHMVASSSKLWDTEQGKAITFGNLIHELMAKVVVADDISFVLEEYIHHGLIQKEELKAIEGKLKEIVKHPKLEVFFSGQHKVFNERELITIDKQLVIPDRLNFNKSNEVTIIDYKTGAPLKKHHQQVLKYEQVLNTMGIKVINKILIYIDKSIHVDEI